MKRSICLLSLAFIAPFLLAKEKAPKVTPLSDAEALAIVEAQETGKEQAKDKHEAKLKTADIIETAVANLGNKRVIFNRVKNADRNDLVEPLVSSSDVAKIPQWNDVFEGQVKEPVNLTLSGTVYDEEISELWWKYEGQNYRIFINANFLLFNSIGEVEDEDNRYSIFAILTGQSTENAPQLDEWRPTMADFSSEELEYYIVDSGDNETSAPTAFRGVEAMLQYYAENKDQMQISYNNNLKIRETRKAYLELNPPKANRDTIINFRPIK
tara:strand:+ start:81 stop:887 length:807 start_codon:yes stop_codon:yes gene_type:complete